MALREMSFSGDHCNTGGTLIISPGDGDLRVLLPLMYLNMHGARIAGILIKVPNASICIKTFQLCLEQLLLRAVETIPPIKDLEKSTFAVGE